MKTISFIATLIILGYISVAQVPSCCSQPGACQSVTDPLWTNDINDNGFNLSYFVGHSSGYLQLPNEYGDTVYTKRSIIQQALTTSFWFSLNSNLLIITRLPLRYIKNSADDVYGIGDATIGFFYNPSKLLKLKEEHDFNLQMNLSVPSGRSYNLDTALMYKSLLQTGSGNFNADIGIRYQHNVQQHVIMAMLTARQSMYQLHNYKNASLYTAQLGYTYRQKTSANTELAYQFNVLGERYLKDYVNGDIAYNSGYSMVMLVPRLRLQHDLCQFNVQAYLPVYRQFQGRQLKLNYIFVSGFTYVF
jgi:hypothetical protein